MIEETIALLTKAVQENTAALNALRTGAPAAAAASESAAKVKKEKPAPEEKTKPVDTKPAFTKQDVRDAAQKLLDLQRADLIRPINSKYGVARVSEVDESKYGEVIADMTAALAVAEKEKANVV